MDCEIKISKRVDVNSEAEIQDFGEDGRRAKAIFDP
jgi:hypothetical protein